MKTIAIELSPESCNQAAKELFRYDMDIKPKLDEVCRRLAEVGASVARSYLELENGNTDATIEEPIQIENGYKLVMSGEDVYFIEFGTGVFTQAHGDAVSVPVYPGSFSEQHAKMFSRYGFWWHGGENYEGTPAYRPLFYAGQAMRQEIQNIMREVLGR